MTTEKAIVTFGDDAGKSITCTAEYDGNTVTVKWDFGEDGVDDNSTGLYLDLAQQFMQCLMPKD